MTDTDRTRAPELLSRYLERVLREAMRRRIERAREEREALTLRDEHEQAGGRHAASEDA